MPHSSGGGSHSGGSHSGSSFGGGSHSGSSHSGPSVRTSKTYFPGARSYVYYRHRRPVYVYANTDLKALGTLGKARYLLLIFYVPFLLFAIPMLLSSFHAPTPLPNTGNYEIVIRDNIGVVENRETLASALQEFKNKTGITPAFVAVNNEQWASHYGLSSYAYELYVNEFDDETHWLIVYSEPSEESPDGYVDWYWEGMQGNDTDSILTDNVLEVFNNNFQKYLIASSKYSVDGALLKAFEDITPTVMDFFLDRMTFAISSAILLFIGVHMYFMVFFNGGRPKCAPDELTELKGVNAVNGPQTKTCEYCGGVYVAGAHSLCPHCGVTIFNENSNF